MYISNGEPIMVGKRNQFEVLLTSKLRYFRFIGFSINIRPFSYAGKVLFSVDFGLGFFRVQYSRLY